jgi:transcriptional regulator with XRE-family HTH domain
VRNFEEEGSTSASEPAHRGTGVGDLVLQARVAAGLTQAELAARIGTSQPTIARWESGNQLPSVRSLLRLAEGTGFHLRVSLRDGHARIVTVRVR